MAEPSITPISTIGIVADIRRDGECDHVATKCSVFGINEKEYNSLSSICEVRPKFFTNEAHRFMVHCRWGSINNIILCFMPSHIVQRSFGEILDNTLFCQFVYSLLYGILRCFSFYLNMRKK